MEVSTYYLYIDLVGEETLFQSLYDFLVEIQAEKVSNCPIWSFIGKAEDYRFYLNKLNEVFLPLLSRYGPDSMENISWNVLIMGPQGFSGTSKRLPVPN